MDERTRNELIRLHLGGASIRRIAKLLSVSRNTVTNTIAEHAAARRGEGSENVGLPRPRHRRKSLLDVHEDTINALLGRYPDITAVRLWEELQARGFEGRYTIVRDHLRELRPRPKKEPVVRFETGPGQQGQMDYSPYDIEFTSEGKRSVNAFSLVLKYSRLKYVLCPFCRVPRFRDHGARAYPGLRGHGRCAGCDPVRQHEGRGQPV